MSRLLETEQAGQSRRVEGRNNGNGWEKFLRETPLARQRLGGLARRMGQGVIEAHREYYKALRRFYFKGDSEPIDKFGQMDLIDPAIREEIIEDIKWRAGQN